MYMRVVAIIWWRERESRDRCQFPQKAKQWLSLIFWKCMCTHVNCACVLPEKRFFTMHVGKRKRVGLYACNCAKCKTHAKTKCFYSYSTVWRHRNIYGTSTAEANEMMTENVVRVRVIDMRRTKEVHGNPRMSHFLVFQSYQRYIHVSCNWGYEYMHVMNLIEVVMSLC